MATFIPFSGHAGRWLAGRSSNGTTPAPGASKGYSPQTQSGGKHGPGNVNAGVNNPQVPFPSSAPTDPHQGAIAGSNIPMTGGSSGAAGTSKAQGQNGAKGPGGSDGYNPQTESGGPSGPGTANAGITNGPLAGKYPAMPNLHP